MSTSLLDRLCIFDTNSLSYSVLSNEKKIIYYIYNESSRKLTNSGIWTRSISLKI